MIALIVLFLALTAGNKTYAETVTLRYDDGTAENSSQPWSSEAGSQIAVRFSLSSAAKLKSVLFFVSGRSDVAATKEFEVRVYKDNSGYPGEALYSGHITGKATAPDQWVTVDLSGENVMLSPGNFYVSMYWLTPPGQEGQYDSQTLGEDHNSSAERTFWKFTGQWLVLGRPFQTSMEKKALR